MDKIATLERLIQPAKGVIFDFDGLLADSERYHFLAYRDVFQRYGHTLDEEEYYKFWTSLGHGARGEIERYELPLDYREIRKEKQPIFSHYCEDGSIKLYKEARELLQILSESAKILAIASGSYRRDIRAVLKNAGVESLVPVIVGSDVVPNIKPAPDLFLKTLDELQMSPRECVVFEDAEKGVTAARASGLPVIVIQTEETRGFDFSNADLTLESHSECIQLVRRIFG